MTTLNFGSGYWGWRRADPAPAPLVYVSFRMPLAWTFEEATRRGTLTFSDPYSLTEWQETVLAIIAAAGAQPFVLLVDRRSCQPPTTEFVDAMTAFFAAHRHELAGSRAAVVVASDVAYGMGRMTCLRTEISAPAFSTCVFREYDEAERWLSADAAAG